MDLNIVNLADIATGQAAVEKAELVGRRQAKTVEEARQTAEQFEAVFLAQMLAPMFQGIKSDGPFGGGHAESIFRGLQVEEFGKAMAARGGIGLADTVMHEILSMQEV